MADTKIEIGLSPEVVIAALKQMGDQTQKLAATMEQALGQKASQSVNDLKDTAEKGTNQITKFFSNMGTRIREDLKTAFDVTGIMAGANFAREIGQGVRSVLDMERAFDRLNVRMGLSARQMEEFKRSAGRAAAEAGVNIKDIQPGLLTAASRGNVRDPQQMTAIAQSLAQARQINPELDTGTVTEDIAEILKRQGMQMNGANFRAAMDAINSATVNGGFKNSNDAAANIAQIAPYAQQLGLDTRSMSGLAAVASRSGDSGENILRQLLAQGTGLDKGARLNSLFGSEVFKNGKLDPAALANINTNQFGSVSQQVLEQTTGITGASGADLKQFVDTWRTNMGDFQKVVSGSNETADQFGVATNNFASKIDMFRARVTNAGAEIGNSLLEMANGVINQDPTNRGASHLAGTLYNSAGDLATAGALSVGAGLLMGGGVRGLIGSKVADAQGIQKVYVTNAGEIAAGGSAGGLAAGALKYGKNILANAAILGTSAVGEIAGMGAGAIAGSAGMLAGAGLVGYGAGKYLINPLLGNDGSMGDRLYDYMNPNEPRASNMTSQMTPEQYRDMIKLGFLEAMQQRDGGRPRVLTNPSVVRGQGASVGVR